MDPRSSASKNPQDQTGLSLKVKQLLGATELRHVRHLFNFLAKLVPYKIKYGIGTRLRRRRYPYCVLEEDDVAVQVGAPRDLVANGRSRAVHYARLVTTGKVIVVEPDSDSARYLKQYAAKHGIGDRFHVVPVGAWKERAELEFLTSPVHPASNLVASLQAERVSDREYRDRRYKRIKVAVDSLDSIVASATDILPKLVSITTNGAEREILEGASQLLDRGCPWVSLAVTGSDYVPFMKQLGYELAALEDRGYTFRREPGLPAVE